MGDFAMTAAEAFLFSFPIPVLLARKAGRRCGRRSKEISAAPRREGAAWGRKRVMGDAEDSRARGRGSVHSRTLFRVGAHVYDSVQTRLSPGVMFAGSSPRQFIRLDADGRA